MKMIPGDRAAYQLQAGPPFGKSEVVAVVTTEPWQAAIQMQLPDDFQPISDSQMGDLRNHLRSLHDDARRNSGAGSWAAEKMVFEIVAAAPHAPAEDAPEPPVSATEVQRAKIEASPAPEPAPLMSETPPEVPASPMSPLAEEATAAPDTDEDTASLTPAAESADISMKDIDDTGISWEDQQSLPVRKPDLFKKLQVLAERFSPVFWQDVSGDFEQRFQPWKDFFVRYDFDHTPQGPNWPEPPGFQDERKRQRNAFLDNIFSPSSALQFEADNATPGMFQVHNNQSGETIRLDLRPFVYWAVLTTPTHFFFHYVVFHAQDWKGLLGHPGDMEGTTIVVDRETERMTAAFTLAHDDVDVVRSLDEDPEPNIGVLVGPEWETRGLLDEDDGRPIEGMLAMDDTRDGEVFPKEHQDVYVETKGHGQYGPKKIKKSRYIIYANFFDNSSFTNPPFQRDQYPETDRFSEVLSKRKYELIFIGSGPSSSDQPSLWSKYRDLQRFSGGVNPPWDWRDNLFFKTGWWRDPRQIKKNGDGTYRINPYLEPEAPSR